jgi:HTH-type transcriptional regulator/antitoxin HipB
MSRSRWEHVKGERTGAGEAVQVGYERARRAFEIGEQVRRLRDERSMTQEELAEKAGTSQPAIARLEAGGAEPKLDTLERIGHALGVELVVRFEARREVGKVQAIEQGTCRG